MTDRIIEGGILLVAVLTLLGGFLKAIYWKIDKVEETVTRKLDKHKEEIDDDLKSIRDELNRARTLTDAEFSIVRREFGETLSAIRQKINDVERDALERYVRRDSFDRVIERLEGAFRSGVAELKNEIGGIRDRLQTHLENQK